MFDARCGMARRDVRGWDSAALVEALPVLVGGLEPVPHVGARAHVRAVTVDHGLQSPARRGGSPLVPGEPGDSLDQCGGAVEIVRGDAGPFGACYGLGGTEPTVSDACVALNRLNPDYFLAGEMTLDRDAAERAISEHIAEPLGMEVADAAEGILRVVTANMNKAIRSILIARGFDIRSFVRWTPTMAP